MSHIFDALQRSQAERAGDDLTSSSAITELLEDAERQAVLRWRAERVPASDARAHGQASVEAKSEIPGIALADLTSVGREVHGETSLGDILLDSCQVLPISPEAQLVAVVHRDSPTAEAFRLLAVRLRHMRRTRALKKLLITSTIPQEGKSMVSANLACSLAAGSGQKVLLLEGDVRRPSQSKIFGMRPQPGLCEWLQEGCDLSASIYRLESAGIWIMPAGHASTNPLELLQSARWPALMEQLAGLFDWILLDSPPALPLADTSVLARLADGVLLVTRQGVTEKRQLQRGLEALDQTKMIGTVLNSFQGHGDEAYAYYSRPTESSGR